MGDDDARIGPLATWSLAVGGMVGGGIFAVLGTVVSEATSQFWVALIVAGLLALVTSRSYVRLADRFDEGGGAFTYLRDLALDRVGGGLGWLLLLGYTLTIALYASTFGTYLSYALGGGGALRRVAALALIAGVVAIELRGVGSSTTVEIGAVVIELVVLLGLVALGMTGFSTEALSRGVDPPGALGVATGAAGVFVAYEGFQLTTYDWDEIRSPGRTLRRTVPLAVVMVIVVYVLVGLSTVATLGAGDTIAAGELAPSVAAEQLVGTAGLVAMTVAALLATGSAVNATLFSTARLTRRIEQDGELPEVVVGPHADAARRPTVGIGVAAAAVALLGSLGTIVEAASLVFLATFALVNAIAAWKLDGSTVLPWVGAMGAAAATVLLTVRVGTTAPVALAGVAVVALAAFVLRQPLLDRFATEE